MPRTIADVVRQVDTGVSRLCEYLLNNGNIAVDDGVSPERLEPQQYSFHSIADIFVIFYRSNADYVEKFEFSRYGELVSHSSIRLPMQVSQSWGTRWV